MNASKVYFTDLRTRPGLNLPGKLEKLAVAAGINGLDVKDKFVAVKLNFGEKGNMAYIRPGYIARIVDILNRQGAKVFLTDANTLYKGFRSDAVGHIATAVSNGFNQLEVNAPVIIADGIKGTDYVDIPFEGGRHFKAARVGRAIADADVIVSVSHFKGHEQAGFGGTLKNIGMGAASVAGKMLLHSDSKPRIDKDACRGCGVCVDNCAHDAITVASKKASIDYDKCVGCGQCVASCLFGAAGCDQDTGSARLNEKIAEYTKAIVQDKKCLYINLMMDISPECDCWGHNDAAIAPNVGFAASLDPVALDQASADLVLAAPRIESGNALSDALAGKAGHAREAGCHHHEGEKDIFKIIHPDTDWRTGLAYAEKIGLGTRTYELIII